MTTEQDQEPTRQLIIPSGFGSSERQRERIAELEEASKPKFERPGSWRSDISDEVVKSSEEKESKFKEFRGSQKPIILDATGAAEEIDSPIREFSSDVEDAPTIIESEPRSKTTSRKLNFFQTFNAARRGIHRGLTSNQAKRIARSTREASTRAAKTGAKVGATTRGAVFVAGKRIEERTLDRPRNQKTLFRPLESRERRLLGLPTNEAISREELRLIALGVTPPSVIRARIAQTNEIDKIVQEYREKLDQLPQEAKIQGYLSALDQEVFQLEKSGGDKTLLEEKKNKQKALREPTRRASEYRQVIQGLEDRKNQILASTDTNVDPRMRNRAFSQALRISPSVNPVGSLKTKQTSNRGPGRPPLKKKPQLNVKV